MSDEQLRGSQAEASPGQAARPSEVLPTIKRSNGVARLDTLQDAEIDAKAPQGQDASRSRAIELAGSQEPDGRARLDDHANGADRELEGLALSSAITELDYAVQNTFSLLFQVQVRLY
jgi:hypothetical protein